MVTVALSLRVGGWACVCRRYLCNEARDTVRMREGASTPDATLYRRRVTWIFMFDDQRERFIHNSSPNGDWRKLDVVEASLPVGSVWDEAVVSNIIAKGLCVSSVSSSFGNI
ncbi:unnamed protein product [Prorocentrum cordatum]|uniref:Uncharacterized protein n=1 Tax=Prorocentrum cordatum TaxID=2364126 RepID=A0ABN9V4Y8_9DINO|nr:unnamed protein product [Polarella glacialis]